MDNRQFCFTVESTDSVEEIICNLASVLYEVGEHRGFDDMIEKGEGLEKIIKNLPA